MTKKARETFSIVFDKEKFSRNQAWNDLLANPPKEVKPLLDRLKQVYPGNPANQNPWRANHQDFLWCWTVSLLSDEELERLKVEPLDTSVLERFPPEQWQSTSNKFRHIAKLPDGLTGLEALALHAPVVHAELMERFESVAAGTFRRSCASTVSGCFAELSPSEYRVWRQGGGRSSF